MSSSTFSFTSTASFNSTSIANGQTVHSSGHSQHATSGPNGSTVHTTSQNLGQPDVQSVRHYDAQGRELLDNNGGAQAKIEDATDADKLYEERIEDEYAKREGGA